MRYHVELQASDGQWERFTDVPLEDETKGKEHLEKIRGWAVENGHDPQRLRLVEEDIRHEKEDAITEIMKDQQKIKKALWLLNLEQLKEIK